MMPAIPHPTWIIYGLIAVLIGIWLIRWASRNNMASAIRDATVGVALDALAKRGRPEMPAELRAKVDDIRNASGKSGKAKKIASYGVRHSLSQIAGITGFILVMSGLVAAVLGVYYE
jgi:hypothetical protein